MNRLQRTSQVHATWLGCWTAGGYVHNVYAPEPPLLFLLSLGLANGDSIRYVLCVSDSRSSVRAWAESIRLCKPPALENSVGGIPGGIPGTAYLFRPGIEYAVPRLHDRNHGWVPGIGRFLAGTAAGRPATRLENQPQSGHRRRRPGLLGGPAGDSFVTREQRCWVHKTANILNKMPKSLHAKAQAMLQDIWMAPSREKALQAFDLFVQTFEAKYPKAVECLVRTGRSC